MKTKQIKLKMTEKEAKIILLALRERQDWADPLDKDDAKMFNEIFNVLIKLEKQLGIEFEFKDTRLDLRVFKDKLK